MKNIGTNITAAAIKYRQHENNTFRKETMCMRYANIKRTAVTVTSHTAVAIAAPIAPHSLIKNILRTTFTTAAISEAING